MNYGEYFGLDARNAYVATASLGNLEGREPMNAVYRTAGMARLHLGGLTAIGGTTPQVLVLTTTGTMAGEVSLSPLPAPYFGSETGTYAQERGGTAYEFTNHLGNVLAVVSDKKLGQGGTTATPIATYYHPETMMLTDYYPFGMAMVGRSWESGEYRYGFNGMQKENEIVGEANGYDFGARLYDGRVGRWWSVDPMWKKYPGLSPYNFSINNPIFYEDEGGMDVEAGFIIINNFDQPITIRGDGEQLIELANGATQRVNGDNSGWDIGDDAIRGGVTLNPGEAFLPHIWRTNDAQGRLIIHYGGIVVAPNEFGELKIQEFVDIHDIDFIDLENEQEMIISRWNGEEVVDTENYIERDGGYAGSGITKGEIQLYYGGEKGEIAGILGIENEERNDRRILRLRVMNEVHPEYNGSPSYNTD